MEKTNNHKVSNDRRNDYQHDPFVVDWSCVTSKKEGV